ncbi:MAG: hypothetical protein PQJ46_05965 [Spirochaetales bacterium]|nr:hypothetical protein [Spirochaetales bacterium]
MMIKFFIGIIGVVLLGFIIIKAVKAWEKADIEEKIDDLNDTTEMYNKIKDVDIDEVAKQKKKLEKFKKI